LSLRRSVVTSFVIRSRTRCGLLMSSSSEVAP
jgi:hypothetical protein